MAQSPKKRVPLLLAGLEALYPEPECALDYRTPLQLVIATVLSAQCTDKRVNLVTPALFARFPDAHSFAAAELSEIGSTSRAPGSSGTRRSRSRASARPSSA